MTRNVLNLIGQHLAVLPPQSHELALAHIPFPPRIFFPHSTHRRCRHPRRTISNAIYMVWNCTGKGVRKSRVMFSSAVPERTTITSCIHYKTNEV
jgi:hypothetical protein